MLMHALADCVINAGLEGFGYSTIQAQAVGTPVIGLNAAATTNLLETGILVPPYSEVLTPNLLTKADPHPTHIMQALERVYQTPRSDFSKGPKFVQDNFAWPLIFEKWKKLFAEVDVELDRRCMKTKKYPPHPSERALGLAAQPRELN
jgi:glycosyltransferase involved in cell wall biosynthesis